LGMLGNTNSRLCADRVIYWAKVFIMGDIKCLSCGCDFDSYQELAVHISASKIGHRRGKKWAAKYLSRHVINKRDNNFRGGTPLSVEDIKNKRDNRRVLSGEQKYTETICPQCRKPNRAVLEAEHATSPQAWRIGGRLARVCASCDGGIR